LFDEFLEQFGGVTKPGRVNLRDGGANQIPILRVRHGRQGIQHGAVGLPAAQ
jgi:hypothetical protein